jgi:hypothetical protein
VKAELIRAQVRPMVLWATTMIMTRRLARELAHAPTDSAGSVKSHCHQPLRAPWLCTLSRSSVSRLDEQAG